MPETSIQKHCPHCKQIKPVSEFYKNCVQTDGLSTDCKKCHNEMGKASTKRYSQTKKGKKARKKAIQRHYILYPERHKAKWTIGNAIQKGRLVPAKTLQCYYCGVQAEQWHHWHGYEPEHLLDVIPVCRKCHQEKRQIAELSNTGFLFPIRATHS